MVRPEERTKCKERHSAVGPHVKDVKVGRAYGYLTLNLWETLRLGISWLVAKGRLEVAIIRLEVAIIRLVVAIIRLEVAIIRLEVAKK